MTIQIKNAINSYAYDKVLSPYVKRTYAKHIEDAEKWQIADALNYAQSKTEKDVYDAFKTQRILENIIFKRTFFCFNKEIKIYCIKFTVFIH